MRTKGMTDFIAVKEAHKDGGCHAHILCQFERKFIMFEYKGKRRVANSVIRDYIKDNWAGNVEIEGMKDDDVKGYIKKYLGKYSHIEDALRRAKREWGQEGDGEHKDADCKKLWTVYYCDKMKTRRFTSSIKKRGTENPKQGENPKDYPPADLIKNMNNLTDDNRPKIVKVLLLPWHIKYNPAFEPYNGKVEPDGRLYRLLENYIKDTEGG
jgi:hypothetical protein